MLPGVFVHIVLWNSARTHGVDNIIKVIKAVCDQSAYKLGENLSLLISDNASSDGVFDVIQKHFKYTKVKFCQLSHNFGFSGAHNIGAYEFIQSAHKYFLVLNPDCLLAGSCLSSLVLALESQSDHGLATPKLIRANESLASFNPVILDACGMVLTSSLRHFDRGSGEQDVGQYDDPQTIFGGTGACLLLNREAVEKLALPKLTLTEDQQVVHFDLQHLPNERIDLFDEAFFAYREDADLCWRAHLQGIKCLYVPKAIGYHRRVVTPERRGNLAPELNRHSVRNRFLLQINNYHFQKFPAAFLPGILFRNLLVLVVVIVKEHSSLPAIRDVIRLWRRALERRQAVIGKD